MTKQEFETLLEERMHKLIIVDPKNRELSVFQAGAEWAFELLNHIPDTEKKVESKYCNCPRFIMIMRDEETQIGYCAECGKEVDETN